MARPSLHLSKFQIVGNLMPRLNYYGKCSKISNTLKLRTPKIITENNF